MSTPEPCTTPTASKRHYSTNLEQRANRVGLNGRSGHTMCGLAGAMDGELLELRRRSGETRPGKSIGELPSCRPCEKAAAKLGDA